MKKVLPKKTAGDFSWPEETLWSCGGVTGRNFPIQGVTTCNPMFESDWNVTWPGDLTLRDLGLNLSQNVRKRCLNRCAKNGGAERRRFCNICEKPEGASIPPARRRFRAPHPSAI